METVTRVETRKPFDMPTTLAKLLQAAGIEQRQPEEVAGMLFGALAHLSVGIATQFPEQWPIFRSGLVTSCDDLRDILTSEIPSAVLDGDLPRQPPVLETAWAGRRVLMRIPRRKCRVCGITRPPDGWQEEARESIRQATDPPATRSGLITALVVRR